MKKYIVRTLIIIGSCTLLIACHTATPEKYFDVAVLNSNMVIGFANNGQLRELESPSAKLVEGKTVSMQRKEVLDAKIQYLDQSFSKVRALKETDDTKDILQASLALYNYVLPVYKNEYTQLAGLYDKAAPTQEILSLSQLIHDKYAAQFSLLYNTLIGHGKRYAEKHGIQVNWAM